MDSTPATIQQDDNARSSAKKWAAILGIWIVLVTVFFWPVFFHGKVLAPLDILDSLLKPWATTEEINVHNAFPYDAISQYLPYNWSVYQSLRQDGYIGWSPNTHNGTAILENTMLCPGDWHHQLYRFLSFWDAWNIGIVLQFLIAGLGMLVLLRHLGIPPAFALLGVVGYGFYSQFIIWYCHRWILGALCWAPWMAWGFLRALKNGKRIDAASALFTALAFRGGHLQSSIFVVIITAIVFLTHLFEARKDKQQAIRVFWLLVSTAFGSALLSIDVWLQTIPAYLQGCPPREYVGWIDSLLTAPMLLGLFIPTLIGTPQGLDVLRPFGTGLFETPFLGAMIFVLGAMGITCKDAPRPAKLLFLAGLLLPLTPASTWLYSRCTPIFALGCSWLATWRLWALTKEPLQKRFWSRICILFIAGVILWTLGSAGIHFGRDRLEPIIQKQVANNLPVNKSNRAEWMARRTSHFLDRSLIWHSDNIAFILLIGTGLLVASQVHAGNRHAHKLAVLIALLAFGELYLYSRTWITFSDRPDSDANLYNTPTWVESLKDAAGNGSVVAPDRSKFDYLQLNTPSAHGIRFQDGYETVTPLRCQPLDPSSFDPADYARAGVSVYLSHPEDSATNIVAKGWIPIHDSAAFKLYRNPAFTSRIHAIPSAGESRPIALDAETASTRTFILPTGTHTVHIAETFNRGWTALANGVHVPIQQSARNGMALTFEEPLASPLQITMRYRPWLQPIYRPIIFATLLVLGATSVFHKRKSLTPSP